MSGAVDICVYEEHTFNKKGVCQHCGGCKCCDQPPNYYLKTNHIGYNTRCIYQYATQLLTNKDCSDISDSENKLRMLNRKTRFRGKDIIIPIDSFKIPTLSV